MKRRAAFSPKLGQFGPNWVNKFFCILSSFLSLSRCFLLLTCVYNCSIHFVFWLLDYSLLHTSSLLLVWFFIEFTTIWCRFFHSITCVTLVSSLLQGLTSTIMIFSNIPMVTWTKCYRIQWSTTIVRKKCKCVQWLSHDRILLPTFSQWIPIVFLLSTRLN